MDTIRVHEDQENRVADNRRGKENTSVTLHNQAQQQKRAVLGVLHNNCVRNTKPVSFFDAFYLSKMTFVKDASCLINLLPLLCSVLDTFCTVFRNSRFLNLLVKYFSSAAIFCQLFLAVLKF